MKNLFTIILVSISFSLQAQNLDLSMGDVAKESIGKRFEDSIEQLKRLEANVQPRETKALRKLLGEVKLLMDYFIFSYPKKERKDQLLILRNDLDEGYETMGHFKDLYDAAQASNSTVELKEVEKRRKLLFKWKKTFLKNIEDREDLTYLYSPLKNKIQKRKNKDLPKFVWRSVSFRPNSNLSARDTLLKLTSELLGAARDDLKDVLKVKNILKYENEELFHDFRKKLRSVLKLNKFYPHLAQEENLLAYQVIDLCVDKYGDLNDIIIAWHGKKSGRKKKELEKKILGQWKVLKRWQEQEDVRAALKELITYYKRL